MCGPASRFPSAPRRLQDDSFLLLFNAHDQQLPFTMPPESFGPRWKVVVDTNAELGEAVRTVGAGESIDVPGRSLVVLSTPSRG
jgi:isoamylase